VSLAKNLSVSSACAIAFKGVVRQIRSGDILCEVVLDCPGETAGEHHHHRAAKRLKLIEGDAVEALVKANEVSLMEVSDEL